MDNRTLGILLGFTCTLMSGFFAWAADSAGEPGFALAFSVIGFISTLGVLLNLLDGKPKDQGDKK